MPTLLLWTLSCEDMIPGAAEAMRITQKLTWMSNAIEHVHQPEGFPTVFIVLWKQKPLALRSLSVEYFVFGSHMNPNWTRLCHTIVASLLMIIIILPAKHYTPPPLWRWRNWGTERWKALSNVPNLASAEAWVCICVPGPGVLMHLLFSFAFCYSVTPHFLCVTTDSYRVSSQTWQVMCRQVYFCFDIMAQSQNIPYQEVGIVHKRQFLLHDV